MEDITGGKGLDPHLDVHRRTTTGDRAGLHGLPVPLRVPQPRLRRLPGLLRLLPAGVPGDLRPRASRRWCRASRSTSSGPTTSSSSSRGSRSSSTSRTAVAGTVDEALAAVAAAPRGDEWVAAWEAAKDPWFNFSSGQRHVLDDKVWLDHPDDPVGLRPRLRRPRAGGPGHRSADARRSAPSATGSRPSTARCCPTTRRARPSTRSSGCRGWCSRTSRTTTSTSSTGRCRCSGGTSASSAQVLADAGFWAEADDIFLPAPRRGPAGDLRLRQRLGRRRRARWARTTGRRMIARRKEIVAALSAKPPPPAMNEPPAVITEPFTIMLYGITTERVGAWLSGGGQRRRADRHGGLAGAASRASRASCSTPTQLAASPGRRDPRHAHHGAELGAGVRPRSARSSRTSAG